MLREAWDSGRLLIRSVGEDLTGQRAARCLDRIDNLHGISRLDTCRHVAGSWIRSCLVCPVVPVVVVQIGRVPCQRMTQGHGRSGRTESRGSSAIRNGIHQRSIIVVQKDPIAKVVQTAADIPADVENLAGVRWICGKEVVAVGSHDYELTRRDRHRREHVCLAGCGVADEPVRHTDRRRRRVEKLKPLPRILWAVRRVVEDLGDEDVSHRRRRREGRQIPYELRAAYDLRRFGGRVA